MPSTPPVVLAYPIRRPGFITGVTWVGTPSDEELHLNVEYVDQSGQPAQTSLYTTPVQQATLCLPSAKGVLDLSDDLFIAHARMAGMISGTIPGSQEYADALKGTGLIDGRNFQMPCGDVKVTDVQAMGGRDIRLTFQKSSGGPTRDVVADIADLATYAFAPSTQLLTVAGAIKKQYPTYVHDVATGKHLTQQQMDIIESYVLGLEPWI